jgi:hypothetical protein
MTATRPLSVLVRVLALALVVSGCRGLAPAAGSGSLAIVPEEAPEACGFPAGTELEYAGRSTTAELGVQEAQGDPMSTMPADIYITAEPLDQGENHGRLVCAIYVDPPGFVEITVHPADDPFVEPTPAPLGTRPDDGVGRREAVDSALAHVGAPDEWEVAVAEAGSVARLVHEWEDVEWAGDLPATHWVWRVFLVRGDEGVDVFIDYVEGTVLGELRYIVN